MIAALFILSAVTIGIIVGEVYLRHTVGLRLAQSGKLALSTHSPQEKKWNAWRFPTAAEISHGADPWDLVFVGSADYPEDAREMLPEQGGQVQEGLTGSVTSYVNPEHELAEQQRKIARDRAERGGDAA